MKDFLKQTVIIECCKKQNFDFIPFLLNFLKRHDGGALLSYCLTEEISFLSQELLSEVLLTLYSEGHTWADSIKGSIEYTVMHIDALLLKLNKKAESCLLNVFCQVHFSSYAGPGMNEHGQLRKLLAQQQELKEKLADFFNKLSTEYLKMLDPLSLSLLAQQNLIKGVMQYEQVMHLCF